MQGHVWIDADNDALSETDEIRFAGVTVELLDGNGDLVASTVTDSDGAYLFTALTAGTYSLRIPAQAATVDYTSSSGVSSDPTAATGDDGIDPGIAGGAISSPSMDITADTEAVDFGLDAPTSATVTIDQLLQPTASNGAVEYSLQIENGGPTAMCAGAELDIIPTGIALEPASLSGTSWSVTGAVTADGTVRLRYDGTCIESGQLSNPARLGGAVTALSSSSGIRVVLLSVDDAPVESGNTALGPLQIGEDPQPQVLAFTGSNSANLAAVALVFVLAGVALTILGRRQDDPSIG